MEYRNKKKSHIISRTVSLVNKKKGCQTLTCSGWNSEALAQISLASQFPVKMKGAHECLVCLLRACINCPWEQRLQISSSSPLFVSAIVIDANGVRIRADQESTVDWCEPLYGKILEWCLRFMHSCSRKGFGMLTFVLLKSTRALITSSLIDLLPSHACHLSYIVLQHNDVKLFQESIKKAQNIMLSFLTHFSLHRTLPLPASRQQSDKWYGQGLQYQFASQYCHWRLPGISLCLSIFVELIIRL